MPFSGGGITEGTLLLNRPVGSLAYQLHRYVVLEVYCDNA